MHRLREAGTGFLRRITTLHPQTLTTSRSLPKAIISSEHGFGQYTWGRRQMNQWLWFAVAGQAAIIIGINSNPALAEDGGNVSALRRIEDGSVISNVHTSKWRVFTDHAWDAYQKGQLDEAERFFISALEEAKEGFGKRDPHVASSCNNLAELYKVRKAFDKAEPLYLDAIDILEESYGPEDIRLGTAVHNLGKFYFLQRRLEDARLCYERALKIKGRVLGQGHTDYADTMYHLGSVLYLQGKNNDGKALIRDSIGILEEGGLGGSVVCITRMRNLAQMCLKSKHCGEAENLQRKVLHSMELTKGWNFEGTVAAAQELALILECSGNMKEARELLERCIDAQKSLLSEDHVKIGETMFFIAWIALKHSLKTKNSTDEAILELDEAKVFLDNSIRISRVALGKFREQESNTRNSEASKANIKERHLTLLFLLLSLDSLGLVETIKEKLQNPQEHHPHSVEAEKAFRQCIDAYREFRGLESSDSPEVKRTYSLCSKHLSVLMGGQSKGTTLQELKEQIDRYQVKILWRGKRSD